MAFGDRFYGDRFFGNRFFGPRASAGGLSMLSFRLLGSTHDTTDGTGAKTTGAFTPNQGERIYLCSTTANGSDASGFTYSVTGGQVLGTGASTWNRQGSVGTTRFSQLHDASYTALDRSMTVSITPSSSITGMNLAAIGVTGFPKMVQVKTANGSSGVAPAVTFDTAVTSGNSVLAFCYVSVNPSALTEPSGFTVLNDSGYATPNGAQQTVYHTSFSGSTVTWGSTATTNWNVVAIELAPGTAQDMHHYIRYGADSTYNVLRIQMPTGGYTGTKGYIVSCPSNQWNWTSDVAPQNAALDACRAQGLCPTVFIAYRTRSAAAYDAQIQDLHDGLQWVITNASTYGLDPTKVGGFGISAGAHLMATAALTGGETNVGGDTTPVGHIKAVYWQFGHNGRSRAFGPFVAEATYGITWGRTAPCSAGSIEENILGTIPCSLASFDWVTPDSGSLSTAKTAVYNKFSPSFWAGQWSGTDAERPKFLLWHGTADDQIPYCSTYNPGTAGTGHALDNGLHQDLVANGFNSSYRLLVGSGHGGNEFTPLSLNPGTGSADVDVAVQWLLGQAGITASGTVRRRRRFPFMVNTPPR
jgi:acetyl esterase/lipase